MVSNKHALYLPVAVWRTIDRLVVEDNFHSPPLFFGSPVRMRLK
eukprot:IDg6347t1